MLSGIPICGTNRSNKGVSKSCQVSAQCENRIGTLRGSLEGSWWELQNIISVSQKVNWAIFWKYKNNEVLNSDWKEILRVLVVGFFSFKLNKVQN